MSVSIWGMDTQEKPAPWAHVGDVLREARERLRLSQAEIEQATQKEVSQTYYSELERGIRRPSRKVIDALAPVLQLSAYRLRALAGHSGIDGTPPDDREAELVAAYRSANEPQREQVLRVVRALLGSS